jgi:hypothetical protein
LLGDDVLVGVPATTSSSVDLATTSSSAVATAMSQRRRGADELYASDGVRDVVIGGVGIDDAWVT